MGHPGPVALGAVNGPQHVGPSSPHALVSVLAFANTNIMWLIPDDMCWPLPLCHIRLASTWVALFCMSLAFSVRTVACIDACRVSKLWSTCEIGIAPILQMNELKLTDLRKAKG